MNKKENEMISKSKIKIQNIMFAMRFCVACGYVVRFRLPFFIAIFHFIFIHVYLLKNEKILLNIKKFIFLLCS